MFGGWCGTLKMNIFHVSRFADEVNFGKITRRRGGVVSIWEDVTKDISEDGWRLLITITVRGEENPETSNKPSLFSGLLRKGRK